MFPSPCSSVYIDGEEKRCKMREILVVKLEEIEGKKIVIYLKTCYDRGQE
jgi:hypothetical protein